VHYRGNAPAITDLIAGHVDLGLQQLVDSLAYIKAGKLKALAVLGPKRVAALPDVPTIGEAGYPDVQGVTFNGLFAPKATPPAVVAQLSVAIRDVLLKPAVVERLAALGSDARGSTPEEFAKFLNDETRKWTAVMKQANIKGTP
jgi:tripartite-type tricarboxylate transporter receptor subunit TctC